MMNTQPTYIATGLYEFYSAITSPTLSDLSTYIMEKPAQAALNPFIRETLLSNLRGLEKRLALRYYSIINVYWYFGNINLNDLANFHAIELFSLVYVSFGSEQAFLKTLLTNYSISEQKIQENALMQNIQRNEEEKKKRFGFI